MVVYLCTWQRKEEGERVRVQDERAIDVRLGNGRPGVSFVLV